MQRRTFLASSVAAMGLSGCLGEDAGESGEIEGTTLTVTTTTSTYDTGLLSVLNSRFEDRFGVNVDPIAQGTGAALTTARNGDADVVIVHARSLEDDMIEDGIGINRRKLMYNDFIIVGPADDPAGIDGAAVIEAFERIATEDVVFVSRGDQSGTHAKERELWEAADIAPSGEWYREAGSGMGEVLNQANLVEGAYTLTDRATYLSMADDLDLGIRVDGPVADGPELLANPYGIIAVNPGVHDHVTYDIAMAYIGFLTAPEGQQLIESYTVNDEQLFFPVAGSSDPQFEQYVPEGWTPDAE